MAKFGTTKNSRIVNAKRPNRFGEPNSAQRLIVFCHEEMAAHVSRVRISQIRRYESFAQETILSLNSKDASKTDLLCPTKDYWKHGEITKTSIRPNFLSRLQIPKTHIIRPKPPSRKKFISSFQIRKTGWRGIYCNLNSMSRPDDPPWFGAALPYVHQMIGEFDSQSASSKGRQRFHKPRFHTQQYLRKISTDPAKNIRESHCYLRIF